MCHFQPAQKLIIFTHTIRGSCAFELWMSTPSSSIAHTGEKNSEKLQHGSLTQDYSNKKIIADGESTYHSVRSVLHVQKLDVKPIIAIASNG
jgi:hypothetical protein